MHQSHHQYPSQTHHHGYGSQPHGFDTHGMSQWATRKTTDLADMRDPRPGFMQAVPAEHVMERQHAERDLGAVAVENAVPKP